MQRVGQSRIGSAAGTAEGLNRIAGKNKARLVLSERLPISAGLAPRSVPQPVLLELPGPEEALMEITGCANGLIEHSFLSESETCLLSGILKA